MTDRPDDRSEDGMGYLAEDGIMYWEPEPKPEPVKRPKRKKRGPRRG